MVKGKAGKLNSLMLLVLIFLGFMGIIMMGIFVYGANLIDQTFTSINADIGNINFTEAYDDTLGKGINVFLDSADNYGLLLLLGMIILMIITSYAFLEKQKVWIVAEFAILIIAFIFAVTIKGAYNTVINSSTILLDIYSIDLIKSSKFILNLHIIIPVVWSLIVILVYGIFRKDRRIGEDIGF